MTERRLPPVLEKKCWTIPMDVGGQAGRDVIALSDLLDWLFGTDPYQGGESEMPEPGLVEQVMQRVVHEGHPVFVDSPWVIALRAELEGKENA